MHCKWAPARLCNYVWHVCQGIPSLPWHPNDMTSFVKMFVSLYSSFLIFSPLQIWTLNHAKQYGSSILYQLQWSAMYNCQRSANFWWCNVPHMPHRASQPCFLELNWERSVDTEHAAMMLSTMKLQFETCHILSHLVKQDMSDMGVLKLQRNELRLPPHLLWRAHKVSLHGALDC
jgi:hypothetical protein